MASVLDAACGYIAAGLSVIPIRADGSKAPAESGWRTYSERKPSHDELRHWFGNGHNYGIGIPGGPASGNLAVLDFETWQAYEGWFTSLPPVMVALVRRCPLAQPPRGGAHVYVRLTESVPGTVLARQLRDGKPVTLIEVRGDGMQVVAPGSPASCHPTGKPYEWLRQSWIDGGSSEPLSLEDWFTLIDYAAALNEYTPPVEDIPKPDTRSRIARAGESPGDDFNRRGTWDETGLFDGMSGWTWARRLGDDRGFVTRPDKDDGNSGTVGMVVAKEGGWPLFYCFTTHGGKFEHKQSYSRFRVYGILKHNSDFSAAAKALAERGYGSREYKPQKASVTFGISHPSDPNTPSSPSTAQSEFRFIDSQEFLAGDYRPRWLVPRILVRGQPGVIAGPSKGMKTSLLIDLAVSMATATPFLGEFPIRERIRVAVVSGESGEHTLKETCLRILQAKQLPPSDLTGWLKWEFNLPTFSDLDSMVKFGEALARIEADVVVIDPTYLALGDVDAKNLFEMGKALKTIAAVLLKLRPGLTVILVHHANRMLPIGEPMELQHLAYSGLEQFARQFILLNRREPYRNDGEHEIWVRVGGSTGHGGLWAVHVSEGIVEEDFTGRSWNVDVRTPDQARDAAITQSDASQRNGRIDRMNRDEQAVMIAVDAELVSGQPGATIRRIRELTSFSHDRAQGAVDRLTRNNVIELHSWSKAVGKGAQRQVSGWRRLPD